MNHPTKNDLVALIKCNGPMSMVEIARAYGAMRMVEHIDANFAGHLWEEIGGKDNPIQFDKHFRLTITPTVKRVKSAVGKRKRSRKSTVNALKHGAKSV